MNRNCHFNCHFCAFAEHHAGLPASATEPAEEDEYTCAITGLRYPVGQLPADCTMFTWPEELQPFKVSDVWV